MLSWSPFLSDWEYGFALVARGKRTLLPGVQFARANENIAGLYKSVPDLDKLFWSFAKSALSEIDVDSAKLERASPNYSNMKRTSFTLLLIASLVSGAKSDQPNVLLLLGTAEIEPANIFS